jgi:hypothetical protein
MILRLLAMAAPASLLSSRPVFGRATLGAFALGVVAVLSVPSFAHAAEGDRSAAEAALAEVAKAGPDGKAAEGSVERAKAALARATAARNSGDSAMGSLLEGLARTHAEMGRDVLRAAAVEAERTKAEARTTELTTDTERKRALIEETAARKQRAAADLAAAQEAAKARAPKSEGKTDTSKEGKAPAPAPKKVQKKAGKK